MHLVIFAPIMTSDSYGVFVGSVLSMQGKFLDRADSDLFIAFPFLHGPCSLSAGLFFFDGHMYPCIPYLPGISLFGDCVTLHGIGYISQISKYPCQSEVSASSLRT